MKIEFAVQMTCESCVHKVEKALSGLSGISKLDIDLPSNTVIVDTELSQSIIKEKIEATGLRTVLKGYGQMGAAVAMLGGYTGFSSGSIKGVVRFIQEADNQCLIDGEIESPTVASDSPLNISIYECGDISDNCSRLGNQLWSILNQNISASTNTQGSDPSNNNTKGSSIKSNDISSRSQNSIQEPLESLEKSIKTVDADKFSHSIGAANTDPIPTKELEKVAINDLGHSQSVTPVELNGHKTSNNVSVNIKTGLENKNPILQETPAGLILKTKTELQIGDIIGRSLVIEDAASNKLACAVIARSAGVTENKKVICACDGVTIWEERGRPLAGPGRRGN